MILEILQGLRTAYMSSGRLLAADKHEPYRPSLLKIQASKCTRSQEYQYMYIIASYTVYTYIYRLYYIVIWVIWYLLFNFYVSRKLVAAMLSYAFLWPSNFALCPQQRGSTVKLANSWEENRTWHDLNMFDLGTNLWRWLQRLSAMPGTRFASPDTRGWVEMGYNLWCLASWADMIQQTSPNWEGCRDKVWVTRLSTRYALFPVAKPIGKLSSKGSWVLNVIDNYLHLMPAGFLHKRQPNLITNNYSERLKDQTWKAVEVGFAEGSVAFLIPQSIANERLQYLTMVTRQWWVGEVAHDMRSLACADPWSQLKCRDALNNLEQFWAILATNRLRVT